MEEVETDRSSNSFTEEVNISKGPLTSAVLKFFEGRLSQEDRKIEKKDRRKQKDSSKSDEGAGGLGVRILFIEII